MKKLAKRVSELLATQHPGVVAAVRSVSFDRDTIAHCYIAGVNWFQVGAELQKRQPSELDIQLLEGLTPEQIARALHEYVGRLA